jgi:hypothetical protein
MDVYAFHDLSTGYPHLPGRTAVEDTNLFVQTITFTLSSDVVNVVERRMDKPPVIGIHRFQ